MDLVYCFRRPHRIESLLCGYTPSQRMNLTGKNDELEEKGYMKQIMHGAFLTQNVVALQQFSNLNIQKIK